MTPHNEAKKDDIAKTVIMPGDPNRAKLIAENNLTNIKLVNEVRGILAYTGYYKNHRVTVMASGMGMPSMGIYSYELFKEYDVDNIIRIGTCGALTKEINLEDIIIPDKAYTLSNFSYQYTGVLTNIVHPSRTLSARLEESAKILDFKFLTGTINTSDIFYSDYKDPLEKENNCLAIEMEAFALFYIAEKLNKNASAILTVTDNLITGERLNSEEREKNLNKAINIVLESL